MQNVAWMVSRRGIGSDLQIGTSSLAAISGWPESLPVMLLRLPPSASLVTRSEYCFCSAFLLIAFVVGQRIPLFATEIVEASRSRVGIVVLAVASQRMQRHLQCARTACMATTASGGS
ncbi:hypothetical protein [Xanthomonas fragariae]|uniref:hypothetical protein n=1 Tax=Xanthomonas fragariae TaxID=48664 RepID=UPI0022AB0625|nr:hypothetical protein [Xanthomonas fragariae]WAT15776.1 hypothetical protein OZ429_05195 [Xanthomonas fragariae]